ncbi:hypothetical protein DENIS_0519 [Desulfonema ishimotonii]|uniref:Uncharacterized protein n=1 Tax=Desulfonema ishimotonii TaxID=45657 RepID=A0A401FRK0_9BACT|nr:hypothetical protein [Desulfonema ishimotonii]GBC59580.1 hypothetical protein DENIS_0519 [Desulfonema ishimotonii]
MISSDSFGSVLRGIIAALLFGTIAACSGSGGDDTTLRTGKFMDSAVEGLAYETDTGSGVTDSDGRFYYLPGEKIRFSVGTIEIGESTATATLTPVDLVEDATDVTHPAVINIARFLQSLDLDNTPENGILISAEIAGEAEGWVIVFDQETAAFEQDETVQHFLDTLNAVGAFPDGTERILCTSEAATAHLDETLAAMGETDSDIGGEGGGGDSDDGGSDSDGEGSGGG